MFIDLIVTLIVIVDAVFLCPRALRGSDAAASGDMFRLVQNAIQRSNPIDAYTTKH